MPVPGRSPRQGIKHPRRCRLPTRNAKPVCAGSDKRAGVHKPRRVWVFASWSARQTVIATSTWFSKSQGLYAGQHARVIPVGGFCLSPDNCHHIDRTVHLPVYLRLKLFPCRNLNAAITDSGLVVRSKIFPIGAKGLPGSALCIKEFGTEMNRARDCGPFPQSN